MKARVIHLITVVAIISASSQAVPIIIVVDDFTTWPNGGTGLWSGDWYFCDTGNSEYANLSTDGVVLTLGAPWRSTQLGVSRGIDFDALLSYLPTEDFYYQIRWRATLGEPGRHTQGINCVVVPHIGWVTYETQPGFQWQITTVGPLEASEDTFFDEEAGGPICAFTINFEGACNPPEARSLEIDYVVVSLGEPIPEPATFLLLGFGGLFLRKRS